MAKKDNPLLSKVRAATQDTFIRSISAGNTTVKASEQAGVDRSTIYGWLREDATFQDRFIKAKTSRTVMLEDAMFATALSGNAAMQIFLACNMMPDRYRNTQYVDAQIKPGGPVTRLSPRELARVAAGENVVKVLADRKDFDKK